MAEYRDRGMTDGYFVHTADGGHFVYDYEKISRETGWSVDQIMMRGVAWCRRNPKHFEATKSDNS